MYQVIDRRTHAVVGTYTTRSRAKLVADNKDNAFGAYRYAVQKVYRDEPTPVKSKYHVSVKLEDGSSFWYITEGHSSVDEASAAVDMFGVCAVTVTPM